VINHRAEPVRLPASGTELIAGADVAGELEVGPGRVAVVRTPRANERGVVADTP
jgi:beta-galactosidase